MTDKGQDIINKKVKKTKASTFDLLTYENSLILSGKNVLAGMDEVGRGPLAGPVVVACVVMPLSHDKIIEGVFDSKVLSEKQRENMYEKIVDVAEDIVLCSADNIIIDKINILNATKKCMIDCINGLKFPCDTVLVDAVKLVDTKYKTMSIIKGDALSYSIAAASIVAKVTRDRLMKELDKTYPLYGFAKNKGYGTAEHIAAIKKYGTCSIHRKSFLKGILNDNEQIGFWFK